MKKISKRTCKGVIEYNEYEKRGFISPVFFCSKSDETSRLVLNFKTLEKFLEYNHLKDVYNSVKISRERSKYLRFYINFFFEICGAPKWIAVRSMKVQKAH